MNCWLFIVQLEATPKSKSATLKERCMLKFKCSNLLSPTPVKTQEAFVFIYVFVFNLYLTREALLRLVLHSNNSDLQTNYIFWLQSWSESLKVGYLPIPSLFRYLFDSCICVCIWQIEMTSVAYLIISHTLFFAKKMLPECFLHCCSEL